MDAAAARFPGAVADSTVSAELAGGYRRCLEVRTVRDSTIHDSTRFRAKRQHELDGRFVSVGVV